MATTWITPPDLHAAAEPTASRIPSSSLVDAGLEHYPISGALPTRFRYAIAGAGCAGLSLAWHLLEAGVTDPILVLDRRVSYINDRTWCFWAVEPTDFDDLSESQWQRCQVVGPDGREAIADSPRYPYRHLRAEAVYRRILDRLARSPQVTLQLGTTVESISEGADDVEIVTNRGRFHADFCFESGVPQINPSSIDVHLTQHFLGITIDADRPVFDSDQATLMDFHVDQADGPRFLYVLPFSSHRALIENTYLSWAEIGPERHFEELSDYLKQRYGLDHGSFSIVERESGRIPMTTARLPGRISPRRLRIGLQAGAARPSSGYAFLRIQRQTRQLAQRLAAQPERIGQDSSAYAPLKYTFLDTIFLKVLQDRPAQAGALFARMFARSRPESLLRFLSDRSGLLDDLDLIWALPKWPFLRAALQTMPLWTTRVAQAWADRSGRSISVAKTESSAAF